MNQELAQEVALKLRGGLNQSTYAVHLPPIGDQKDRWAVAHLPSGATYCSVEALPEPWRHFLANRGNPNLTRLVINTRHPEKWRFLNTETGDVWRWDTNDDKYVRVLRVEVLGGPNATPNAEVELLAQLLGVTVEDVMRVNGDVQKEIGEVP